LSTLHAPSGQKKNFIPARVCGFAGMYHSQHSSKNILPLRPLRTRVTNGSGREEKIKRFISRPVAYAPSSPQSSQSFILSAEVRETNILPTLSAPYGARIIKMDINEITSKVIKAALAVHNELGPGLLESVYQECLRIELEEMGLNVKAEVQVPVTYRGREITKDGFRIDLLIEDTVVVELKSVEEVKPVHKKQLLTYLRLINKPVGLLINFNEAMLKKGIFRIVNSYAEGVADLP